LAPEEDGFDRGRAVAIALLHDLAEARTGDLPRSAASYLPPGAKRSAEEAAFAALAAPLGAEAAALHAEYEAGTSREAQWVRACDRLQLMVKVLAYESWGAGGLSEFWGNPQNFPDSARFPGLAPLVAALRERRAALASRPR